eukprot:CAMPEP_0113973042 /NCGR_PEP_ID=MMETSP0011_2-20120614/14019_1 /TAXON_ID=101924 /ORGANISM="Rhodosorus marinus" /LENGTH=188 /DNA_ID=CAMNT_0000990499 /DNA_START=533 /DNA_END=1098 /DNA_ORIENTATION=- /assembly_acc=CAM_ASM_000156
MTLRNPLANRWLRVLPRGPEWYKLKERRSGTIGEPKSEDLDAYGMKGFLKVMAPSNPDVALLSLGIDLRTLGLNLNSPEPHLHESFKSPFGDRSASQKGDPEYQIPSCYFTQPNQMQASHFSKLQLETLFYIFYSMPQDVLQTTSILVRTIREMHMSAEHPVACCRRYRTKFPTEAWRNETLAFDLAV